MEIVYTGYTTFAFVWLDPTISAIWRRCPPGTRIYCDQEGQCWFHSSQENSREGFFGIDPAAVLAEMKNHVNEGIAYDVANPPKQKTKTKYQDRSRTGYRKVSAR